ncbi:VOC family protein [Streptomyces triticagri]|uniref:VOC family protein n=1 Tax=Streptomyces triticagri TaxID=2293568 RepID=A0A372M4H4_9ACTN|nr:VOC family protein [Streptomyces triticagri]RFU85207.1 VOC family protein [Streptomyces triticagri]
MTSRFEQTVVDCQDPRRLALFWCGVLGYTVHEDRDGEKVEIGPASLAPLAELRRGPVAPQLLFVRDEAAKHGKNRLHIDVCPIDSDQPTEVERICALGATRVDIGAPKDASWTVLADPEGNEFCVLRSLAPGEYEE